MHLGRQKTTEFMQFYRVMVEHGCRSFLEVGSQHGDTFFAVGCTMDRVCSVDMPGGSWGSGDSKELLLERAETLRRLGVDTKTVFGDSRSADVIEQVQAGAPYDAVFIDADHSYDSVRHDWMTYGKMASKVVGFHDIIGPPPVEVPRLWSALKKEFNQWSEFVEYWGDRPMGIGVIVLEGKDGT